MTSVWPNEMQADVFGWDFREGSSESGRWGWGAEGTKADLSPFILSLSAWNLDAMLEVEQLPCAHKVTIRIKSLEKGGPEFRWHGGAVSYHRESNSLFG